MVIQFDSGIKLLVRENTETTNEDVLSAIENIEEYFGLNDIAQPEPESN